jgi:DNA polymerase-3 subunit alpha
MGSKLKFAHLHQHTQFSLLDGAAKLQDLLKWVKETTPEDPALAMTDHGNLFGAVEFYKKATAMGVKPIIGYEAYVAAESCFDRKRGKGLDGGYFHLTLLAKDFTGYQNLVRLASRAYLEGFYEKPRIDREILREHAQGLIALSGCLGAEIPQFILQDRLDLAEARLNEYLSIFGDRFFIEIQNHGLPEQQKVNQVLKEFARKYGLGLVATNDGHYVRKEDARAHEVLLAIQSKTTLDDLERWRFPCDEFYVKTPEEMRAMLPEAEWGDEPFDNTVEIARMCDVDLPIGDKMVYRIPRFPLPEGRTEAQYLRELTFLGLLRRYPDRVTEAFYREVLRLLGTIPPHGDERALAEALARVEEKAWEELRKRLPPLEGVREWTAEAILHRALYELAVIERMGFPGYFLIVQDYINWARGHGVSVGPGRGSAAGSLVAYAVGITNIDPLRFGLLFERFLNPERVSMPDIDTDFSDRERDRVIQYVRERYGEDKVAQIGTFGSLASKAALKDVARVYGIPHKKAEELAKLIPVQFGKPKPLQEAIQVVPELRAEMEKDERIRQVIEVAMRLEGLNRHASVHAAGVVIAAEPLTDLVPLMRDQEGRPVTQYDMGAVEALGLLKMDFLGLRTLTFLDEARRIVKESKGVELDYDRLPLDDPKTFELLSRGETKGVFQLESGGMTATVRGLKPRRLEDIIALVSLYRPGPMEHIPTYIRRHHGQEPVSYAEFPHAEKYLRPILDETYGIPVYQEQIMQIASAVAGYSLGEADLLRRCLAEGSLVLDAATGQRVPIEAVKPGMEVLSLGPDYRFYRVPVLEVLESGVREVVRLRTRSGRTLVLTPDHPLLTLEGWKPLCDLPLGTPIAVPAELPTGGHLAPSEERITLLALLLGDGNTKVSHPKGPKPNAYFYSKDPELLAAYQRSAEALGARVKAYVHPTTGVVTLATSAPRPGAQDPVKRLVEEAGMVARAEEKRVPEEVFRYKKEALALFLGRLFSTDGSVGKVRISYSSASLALVEDVAHLLLRLGIVGQVRSRGPRAHEVLISGREDILRFAEVVGPYLLGAKREWMYALKVQAQARLSGQGWHLRLVPPSVAHRISEAKGKSGFSWREAGERVGIPGNHLSGGLNLKSPRRHLSRHRLLLLGEAFADPSLKALAEAQVLWDPIVAVEPVGKARTYDLRVPPFANFVAGDLVVHNSMGKKKVEEMKAHRERFVRGAKERGVPEEEANRLFDMLEAFANYGFNKCLPARAKVVDWRTGRVVSLGEIVRGEAQGVWVVSLDEARLRLVPRPVVAAFSSGRAQVYALRTATGRVLEATANHPLFTPQGWRPLGALAPGDYVALPRHLPYRPSAHLAPFELDLLGFALSEGNLRHSSGFHLYTSSEEELAAMEEALKRFPNTRTRVAWHRGVAHLYVGRQDRKREAGAVAFLREQGLLGLSAREKRLPEVAYRLPPEEVARFLGRLWTGDGGVDSTGRLIHYATASRALAEGVQHLLLRLGLQSRLVEKRFAYKEGRTGYAVYLLGGLKAAHRFAQVIGPHLIGKRRRDLEALLASWEAAGRSTEDILLLAFLDTVKAALAEASLGQVAALLKEAGLAQGLLRPGRGRLGLSRATLERLAALTGNLALLRLAQAEVYWDRVEAIEPLGEEEVFDLTVEGTHTFIAEDVIVHNSHAAAYSLLSYQTAYVKAHYPVEFMAALLSVERHDSDKVAEYIRDARALGIPVLPPDVNRSGFDFKVVGEEILFGLSAVKNVGEMAARAILEERERGGPFKSLGDFLKRLPEQVVNKRALESLVKAGALDAFGDRARFLASLEPLLRWAAEVRGRGRSGLVGLFAEVEEPPLVEASPLDEITMLRYEKEALGIYVSGHPVLRYPGLREVASCSLEELPEFVRGFPGKPRVLLAGMVEEVVRKPTRSGGMMARFTLSDETGALEVVVFGRAYEGVSPKLKEDIPLLVLAEVEKGEELRVLAQAVWTLEEVLEAPRALEVEVDHALLDEKGVARLKSLLDEHPGSLPVYLRVQGPFGEALFALREVRVGEEALGLLEAEGYRAYLVPDREVFLQGNGGGPKEEVVPF